MSASASHFVPNTYLTGQYRDLVIIRKKLEDVKGRHAAKPLLKWLIAGIKSADDATTIAQCTSRLEWAVRIFLVQGQVQQSVEITNLARNVADINRDHKLMHGNIVEIKSAVRAMASQEKSPLAPTLPSAVIPAKPQVFYDRDDFVKELVSRVVSCPSPRLGILGPGGLGKTSVALTVLWHDSVIHHFGQRRHWVVCETANAEEILLDALARALRVPTLSNDRRDDILHFLDSDGMPRLVVLDNFETPCDIPGKLSKIIDILADLFHRSHVVVVVTMRGEALPGRSRLEWTEPPLSQLGTLSKTAAADLFIKISRHAYRVDELDDLLSALGCMPLAVTLVAQVASEGETPTQLLNRWNVEGVDLTDQDPDDRLNSLAKSIDLSLKSNAMKRNPDALKLLQVLALLPGGARSEILPKVVPTLGRVMQAKDALSKTSLIYSTRDTSGRIIYHVLPPVRRYITSNYTITSELWQGVCDFFVQYVTQHRGPLYDPWAASNVEAIRLEDLNIDAVFLKALQVRCPECLLEAALGFCSYQWETAARLAVIEVVVEQCRLSHPTGNLIDSLMLLGYLKEDLNDYDGADQAYLEAKALLELSGDRLRFAQVLRALANVANKRGMFEAAMAHTEAARKIYKELGSCWGQQLCAKNLADHYLFLGRYGDARKVLQEGHHCSACRTEMSQSTISTMARVNLGEGRYATALDLLQQKVESSGDLWDRYWAGLAHAGLSHYTAASEIFEELVDGFGKVRDRNGVAEAKKQLGRIYWMTGRPADAERILREASQEFETIHQPDDVADCLRSLGDTARVEGRFQEARSYLDDAHEALKQHSMAKETAECLESLADIDLKEGRTEDAIMRIREALAMWRQMNKGDSIASCEARLEELEGVESAPSVRVSASGRETDTT